MEVTEGTVTVEVPEQPDEGVGEAVFFNPRQELNRDVTVAALSAYRERAGLSAPSYLDATAASGIRGVRAAAAGWRVTCCDHDDEAVALARANLARNGLEGAVVHRDANAFMHEHRRGFDAVDVDPFGTPVPFVDAATRASRRLLCVTATDTAPLCGAHFRSGVRSYGAVPLNTEYHAEMGVRVLLSALARTAARYDVGVTPLLTHASDHYVRTYLDLDARATAADRALEELGHVDHCRDCLYREASRGLLAHPAEVCPNCGADVRTAGPLWLGPVRDREFVARVREHLDDSMGTGRRARRLLDRLEAELDAPTHYDQHELCELWGEPASAMDEFLEALRAAGHRASRTHYGGTTFKTDADVAAIHAARPDVSP
jgi:tRNA (guanine26-N2/guanine27-N2)-dimethyltransferase